MNTHDLGRSGEDQAVKWLKEKGHKIIFRNFRRRGFEIDIISVCTENILRFIEVKTVDKGSLGDAAFSIENRNISNYIKGVEVFLSENSCFTSYQISMDAIVVMAKDIHYYQNITGELAF